MTPRAVLTSDVPRVPAVLTSASRCWQGLGKRSGPRVLGFRTGAHRPQEPLPRSYASWPGVHGVQVAGPERVSLSLSLVSRRSARAMLALVIFLYLGQAGLGVRESVLILSQCASRVGVLRGVTDSA